MRTDSLVFSLNYWSKVHVPDSLKAKTQQVRVWSEERFTDGEGTKGEDWTLVVPEIHVKSTEFRLLLGQGYGEWEGAVFVKLKPNSTHD